VSQTSKKARLKDQSFSINLYQYTRGTGIGQASPKLAKNLKSSKSV
jgi:hypothetical protein